MSSPPPPALPRLLRLLHGAARAHPGHRLSVTDDLDAPAEAIARIALAVADAAPAFESITVNVPRGDPDGEGPGLYLAGLVKSLSPGAGPPFEFSARRAVFRLASCVLTVYERGAEFGADAAELVTLRCDVNANSLYIFVDPLVFKP
jgi:hypothetical protein